jgi:trans-2,3-dihydro-3-hydroxyanthranilate isomerase
VTLLTGAGIVTVTLRRDGDRVVAGEMQQPVPTWAPLPAADAVLSALGIAESALPVEVYDNGPRHVFVALPDAGQVGGLRPDMVALQDAGEFGVSCFARDGDRIKTRMFGPALGVAEDPATGSAAGPLAVHLARHGWTRFGEQIVISQGAEIGRPSVLRAVAHGSPEQVERVLVAGEAVIVARGEYRLQ